MRFCQLLVVCCTVALSAIAAAPAAVGAAEPITVELQSGRVITGETDSQTDDRLLWLRRDVQGAQLTSGFPWNQVRRVQTGNMVFVGSDFLPVAQSTKSTGKRYAEFEPAAAVTDLREQARAETEQTNRRAGEELWQRAAQRRVNTLYIEAYLANLDADPQADGLRVFVYPLAADGELVPVNGQIDLYLLGEVERGTGIIAPPQMPQFGELERRSHLVRPTDFARGAGIYELPFRQFHPDFYFDVARQAVVNARLGVPGQGVFIASDANLQLRGFSRIRDELQMQTKQRFFERENAIERDAAPPPPVIR
jgi:hypothetical protein